METFNIISILDVTLFSQIFTQQMNRKYTQ